MAEDALERFSGKPALLVLADTNVAGGRARHSAELAGCRVSAVVPIDGAVERLGRQAFLDAAWVEVEKDHGEPLDALLGALDEAARSGRHGSVVAAPAALIDAVSARISHPRVIHLCGASEPERVAAVAAVALRPRQRLHDVGKEEGQPRLRELSEEVGRIASILASLSVEQAEAEPPPAPEGERRKSRIGAGAVRAIIKARRLRDHYLGADLFADPAWDILLDLFAARLEKRRVAVSSLCIAAAVPPTTGLRWIRTLTDLGLIVRTADPEDGRRVYIELSPRAAEAMEAYLDAAQRVSPLAP